MGFLSICLVPIEAIQDGTPDLRECFKTAAGRRLAATALYGVGLNRPPGLKPFRATFGLARTNEQLLRRRLFICPDR